MSLTKKQKETLRLIKLGYTVAGIANYCKITKSSVYKRISYLEKNFYLKKSRSFGGGTTQKRRSSKKAVRLHGQMWQINILYSSALYLTYLKSSNYINFNSFKCRLYKNSITLWMLRDFISSSENNAHNESTQFLEGCLLKLESRLSICLLKTGYQNIREVKSHFSEINNELARDYNQKNKKLSLKAKEDGKQWVHIDNSFNLNELEFTHTETAKPDSENVRSTLQLFRDYPFFLHKLSKDLELIKDKLKIKDK